MKAKTIGDIMSVQVMSILPSETLGDAFRIMNDYRYRHVPVVNEDHEIIGILSDRDIQRAIIAEGLGSEQISDQDLFLQNHPVSEVMSVEPETIDRDAPIADGAKILLENQFDCLAVTEGLQLVGIVTSTDFLKTFSESADEAS